MSALSAFMYKREISNNETFLRIRRNTSTYKNQDEEQVVRKKFLYKQLIPWAYLLDDKFVSILGKVPLQQTQIHPDIRSSSGL